MILHGINVILRPIELEDADLLRNMINDPKMEAFVVGYSFPVSKLQQSEWIKNLGSKKNEFRAIIDVKGTAIGMVMLTDIDFKNGTAEIHIKIADTKHRGCGYGKDVIDCLTSYAFDDLRLNCIYCSIREDNVASQKLFESCGYECEGVLRNRIFKSGQHFNLLSYSKVKE